MESCFAFDEYSYFDCTPLKISELPKIQTFSCACAERGQTCRYYTPISEVDLLKTIDALGDFPDTRCLIIDPPPDHLQGNCPVKPLHLNFWSVKYRELPDFYLGARQLGTEYPCGKEAACLKSPQVRQHEEGEKFRMLADINDTLYQRLKQEFPKLGGRLNDELNYEILFRYATRRESGPKAKAISTKELARTLECKLDDKLSKVKRVLAAAKKQNPTCFADIEKERKNRAKFTRGGEVGKVKYDNDYD